MSSSTLEAQAQTVLNDLGLDVPTAVTIFLQRIVHREPICFEIIQPQPAPAVRPPFQFGCMKGQIWMADDFDAPLDDFEEYM